MVGPVPLAAFVGALGGVAAELAARPVGGWTRHRDLLLAGVAVTAFLTAVQTFVQQLNTDTLHRVYTWTLGVVNVSGWIDVWLALPYVTVAATCCACAPGCSTCSHSVTPRRPPLGFRPGLLRLVLLGAASLATAAAVAVSGLIGFVGIVVPHIVRLLAGASYRVIVPLSC